MHENERRTLWDQLRRVHMRYLAVTFSFITSNKEVAIYIRLLTACQTISIISGNYKRLVICCTISQSAI